MSPDPQRFAQLVLDAFSAAGLFTVDQIVRAGGPSSTAVSMLRKVAEGERTMAEPREPTWTKIDKAAGWAAGSARRVWRGEAPVGAGTQDGGYVASPGERTVQGISNEDLMREILRSRAEYDQLRAEVRDLRDGFGALSERVDRLEPRS